MQSGSATVSDLCSAPTALTAVLDAPKGFAFHCGLVVGASQRVVDSVSSLASEEDEEAFYESYKNPVFGTKTIIGAGAAAPRAGRDRAPEAGHSHSSSSRKLSRLPSATGLFNTLTAANAGGGAAAAGTITSRRASSFSTLLRNAGRNRERFYNTSTNADRPDVGTFLMSDVASSLSCSEQSTPRNSSDVHTVSSFKSTPVSSWTGAHNHNRNKLYRYKTGSFAVGSNYSGSSSSRATSTYAHSEVPGGERDDHGGDDDSLLVAQELEDELALIGEGGERSCTVHSGATVERHRIQVDLKRLFSEKADVDILLFAANRIPGGPTTCGSSRKNKRGGAVLSSSSTSSSTTAATAGARLSKLHFRLLTNGGSCAPGAVAETTGAAARSTKGAPSKVLVQATIALKASEGCCMLAAFIRDDGNKSRWKASQILTTMARQGLTWSDWLPGSEPPLMEQRPPSNTQRRLSVSKTSYCYRDEIRMRNENEKLILDANDGATQRTNTNEHATLMMHGAGSASERGNVAPLERQQETQHSALLAGGAAPPIHVEGMHGVRGHSYFPGDDVGHNFDFEEEHEDHMIQQQQAPEAEPVYDENTFAETQIQQDQLHGGAGTHQHEPDAQNADLAVAPEEDEDDDSVVEQDRRMKMSGIFPTTAAPATAPEKHQSYEPSPVLQRDHRDRQYPHHEPGGRGAARGEFVRVQASVSSIPASASGIDVMGPKEAQDDQEYNHERLETTTAPGRVVARTTPTLEVPSSRTAAAASGGVAFRAQAQHVNPSSHPRQSHSLELHSSAEHLPPPSFTGQPQSLVNHFAHPSLKYHEIDPKLVKPRARRTNSLPPTLLIVGSTKFTDSRKSSRKSSRRSSPRGYAGRKWSVEDLNTLMGRYGNSDIFDVRNAFLRSSAQEGAALMAGGDRRNEVSHVLHHDIKDGRTFEKKKEVVEPVVGNEAENQNLEQRMGCSTSTTRTSAAEKQIEFLMQTSSTGGQGPPRVVGFPVSPDAKQQATDEAISEDPFFAASEREKRVIEEVRRTIDLAGVSVLQDFSFDEANRDHAEVPVGTKISTATKEHLQQLTTSTSASAAAAGANKFLLQRLEQLPEALRELSQDFRMLLQHEIRKLHLRVETDNRELQRSLLSALRRIEVDNLNSYSTTSGGGDGSGRVAAGAAASATTIHPPVFTGAPRLGEPERRATRAPGGEDVSVLEDRRTATVMEQNAYEHDRCAIPPLFVQQGLGRVVRGPQAATGEQRAADPAVAGAPGEVEAQVNTTTSRSRPPAPSLAAKIEGSSRKRTNKRSAAAKGDRDQDHGEEYDVYPPASGRRDYKHGTQCGGAGGSGAPPRPIWSVDDHEEGGANSSSSTRGDGTSAGTGSGTVGGSRSAGTSTARTHLQDQDRPHIIFTRADAGSYSLDSGTFSEMVAKMADCGARREVEQEQEQERQPRRRRATSGAASAVVVPIVNSSAAVLPPALDVVVAAPPDPDPHSRPHLGPSAPAAAGDVTMAPAPPPRPPPMSASTLQRRRRQKRQEPLCLNERENLLNRSGQLHGSPVGIVDIPSSCQSSPRSYSDVVGSSFFGYGAELQGQEGDRQRAVPDVALASPSSASGCSSFAAMNMKLEKDRQQKEEHEQRLEQYNQQAGAGERAGPRHYSLDEDQVDEQLGGQKYNQSYTAAAGAARPHHVAERKAGAATASHSSGRPRWTVHDVGAGTACREVHHHLAAPATRQARLPPPAFLPGGAATSAAENRAAPVGERTTLGAPARPARKTLFGTTVGAGTGRADVGRGTVGLTTSARQMHVHPQHDTSSISLSSSSAVSTASKIDAAENWSISSRTFEDMLRQVGGARGGAAPASAIGQDEHLAMRSRARRGVDVDLHLAAPQSQSHAPPQAHQLHQLAQGAARDAGIWVGERGGALHLDELLLSSRGAAIAAAHSHSGNKGNGDDVDVWRRPTTTVASTTASRACADTGRVGRVLQLHGESFALERERQLQVRSDNPFSSRRRCLERPPNTVAGEHERLISETQKTHLHSTSLLG